MCLRPLQGGGERQLLGWAELEVRVCQQTVKEMFWGQMGGNCSHQPITKKRESNLKGKSSYKEGSGSCS